MPQKPWEKYQQQPAGPWDKYASPTATSSVEPPPAGISAAQLRQQLPQVNQPLGSTPAEALTFGVDPMSFANRMGGAAGSVINTMFPGGDTPRPNATLPAMTPDQEIGAKVAAVTGAAQLAGAMAPGVSSIVRAGLNEVTTADRLMTGAATSRARAAVETSANLPISKAGVVKEIVRIATKPGRIGKAAMQEKIARWISKLDEAPLVPDTTPLYQGAPPESPPVPSIQATGRNAVTGLDASSTFPAEAGGPAQPNPIMPRESAPPVNTERLPFPGESQAPLNIPRPQSPYQGLPEEGPSSPGGAFFENVKPRAGPTQEIPMANPPELGGAPKPPAMTAPELNRWMNVQAKQMVHGANPAQQILDDGLLAPTKEGTLSNVKTALTDTGDRMQSALQEAGQKGVRIDAEQSVMTALDDATKTIGKRSDAAFQTALTNVLDDILHKHPDLRQMPPTEVHALKVDIGDAVKWGRGATYEADVNQVLVDIYKKLNQDIKTRVEGIGPLQSRWGNLYQGVKSLQNSMLKDAIGRGTGSIPIAAKKPPTLPEIFARNRKR